MVAPLVIGAAVMGGAQLAGTGLQMYGQQRQQRATDAALREYQRAAAANFDAEQAAMGQGMREAQGEQQARLGSLNQYLQEYRNQPAPTGTAPDPSAIQAQMGQGGVANWQQGAGGGAASQFQGQQAAMGADQNAALSKQLIAAWRDRQDQLRADEASTKLNMRELQARARGGDMQARQQLSAALRQLAWQRQQIQLQSALNAAQKAGGGEMMAGQLLGAGGGAIGAGMMAYGAGPSTQTTVVEPMTFPGRR